MTRQRRSRRRTIARFAAGMGLVLIPARAAVAQALSPPDASRTTTLTATVVEQARVAVPSGVAFNVTNVTLTTGSGDVSVAVETIVLTAPTKQLRIALSANATAFTPPVPGATTWSATDVSWTSGPGGGPKKWQNATGIAGSLTTGAYTTVAICNPGASSCSTTGLKFNLGPKPMVRQSGSHSLVVTWKFESLGT